VNVGNAGSVQGIAGTLNLENPPSFTTVNLNDSADTTTRDVWLSTLGVNPADSEHDNDTWGQIGGLAPASINYEYADTSSVTVRTNGGASGDTINVTATGTTTNLVSLGSGLTTVIVGNLSNVEGIVGTLNIEHPGTSGGNAINVYDLADPLGHVVGISTLGVNPADSGGNGDTWGQIVGLAPASINYEYGDTTSLSVWVNVVTVVSVHQNGGVPTRILP
jgi:hypothetical protein